MCQHRLISASAVAAMMFVNFNSNADVPSTPHFCLRNACFAFFEGNYAITRTSTIYDKAKDTESVKIFFDKGIVITLEIGEAVPKEECKAQKRGVRASSDNFASGTICLELPPAPEERSRAVYVTIVSTSEPSRLGDFMSHSTPGLWSIESFPNASWAGGLALRIGKEQHMYEVQQKQEKQGSENNF